MIEFKMKWYKDEYGNKARMWEIYIDGVKNELEICHVCKKYYNAMYRDDADFEKDSLETYAVSGIEKSGGEVIIGDFETLAEAKKAATDYLRG